MSSQSALDARYVRFLAGSQSALVMIVLIILIGIQTSALMAVEVKMGKEDEVIAHLIETPNLQGSGSVMLPWNPAGLASFLPRIEPGHAPAILPAIAEGFKKWSESISSHPALLASGSMNIRGLKGMLGGSGPFEQKGAGTAERVALRDGIAMVEVYLPTRQPATMDVRVINPDNTEQLYSGEFLLTWMRPNDSAKAPVKFQGVDQPDSMTQVSSGDWSPKQNLKYSFPLKAGQRVILHTSGNPLQQAYIRVTSNAF